MCVWGGGHYLWATPPGRKLEMWARLSLSIPPIKKNITEVNIYIVLILLNHVYILYMGEVFLSCKNLKLCIFITIKYVQINLPDTIKPSPLPVFLCSSIKAVPVCSTTRKKFLDIYFINKLERY